ncbi:MAG: hypothetical protein E7472_02275 [Ruminococcaceae bacterium]|nr:hypothetical protein [Oscillospiraceae bacterium]
MEKSSKLTRFLERLFLLFLFINPLLDIFNGFFISNVLSVGILDVEFVSTLGVTPSLVVRMLFLVTFAAYIILVRDKHSILTALPIGLAFVLSVVSEYLLLGSVRIFVDAQYMARFCYNIALLMVYTRVFATRWGDDGGKFLITALDNIITYTLIAMSLAILVPAILGLGYSTYADRLGYRGNRGFFYAGNDVTAVLAMLLPLSIAHVIRGNIPEGSEGSKRRFPAVSAVAAALGADAMLVIGSKTAFLAFALTIGLLFIFVVIFSIIKKQPAALLRFVSVIVIICLILLLLTFISYFDAQAKLPAAEKTPFNFLRIIRESEFLKIITDSLGATEVIAEQDGAAMAVLSGRQHKLADQLRQFREGGIVVWLFGLGRGSQEVIVEMDLFEVLFYYGVFGFAAMMWLYFKLAIAFFANFFKKFDVRAFAAFIALGMIVGYLTVAGHVLFSVTSGFYLAFTIAYSRVCFAESAGDILLWKKT